MLDLVNQTNLGPTQHLDSQAFVSRRRNTTQASLVKHQNQNRSLNQQSFH